MKYVPVSQLYSSTSSPPPLPPAPPPPPAPSLSASSLSFLSRFYTRRRIRQQGQQQHILGDAAPQQSQFAEGSHPQQLLNGIAPSQQHRDDGEQHRQQKRKKLQQGKSAQQQPNHQKSNRQHKNKNWQSQRRLSLQRRKNDRREKYKLQQRNQRSRLENIRYPIRNHLGRLSSNPGSLCHSDRDGMRQASSSQDTGKDDEKPSGKSAKKKKSPEKRKITEIEESLRQPNSSHPEGHMPPSCIGADEGAGAEASPGKECVDFGSLPGPCNDVAGKDDLRLPKKIKKTDAVPLAGEGCNLESPLQDWETRTAPSNSSQETTCAQMSTQAEEGRNIATDIIDVQPGSPGFIENIVSLPTVIEDKCDAMVTQAGSVTLQESATEEVQGNALMEVKYFYQRRIRRSILECGLMGPGDEPDVVANLQNDNRSSGSNAPPFVKVDKGTFEENSHLALQPDTCKEQSWESRRPSSPSQDLFPTDSLKRMPKKSRVPRELLALTSNGYHTDEKGTKSLSRIDATSTCTARKKRKMQKVHEILNLDAEKRTPVEENETLENPHGFEVSTNISTKTIQKDAIRKWRDLKLGAIDSALLIGCKCKVYWPLDDDWYTGVIGQYNTQMGTHYVIYDDGDQENIVLANEVVKLFISEEEMTNWNVMTTCVTETRKKWDYQEMAALAASLEDIQGEFGHGELVWAKIKGHPLWPAFVMDEKHADECGLEANIRENTLPVQFFGSYDYARISLKQAISFSSGLLCKLHTKCKKMSFDRGLEEAERYLKERKLPDTMSKLQDEVLDTTRDDKTTEFSEEDEDFMGDERTHKTKKSVQSLFTCPIKLGALQVLSLGKIVKDSEHFHDEHHIWTEGYTAIRKFTSVTDPSKLVDYKMEVMKDPLARTRPLFRVTSNEGELAEGPSPSACWKKIYQKVEKFKEKCGQVGPQHGKKRQQFNAGDSMFGFTNPRISKLIQGLPYARVCSKFTGWFDKTAAESSEQILPAGYKPVEVEWKHPDRCNVCYLDEEYVNNLFLHCDKCRTVVHMHCYGESEPPNGHLWLCQICRLGAPAKSLLCCLCPIQGGAMKRTTDGRWAHLTCALWIPETCLVDIKQMEPIDGLKSINKERWKLTCSICKVPYGVCIQCSELSCRVAYHILCARSAGLVLEVLEESSHKGKGLGEDLEQPIRLLSYCRRHRQPKEDRDVAIQQDLISKQTACDCSAYRPPQNSSGCARSEPYNCAARRGRQEPEIRVAASAKRLYVEKMPYRVGIFCRKDSFDSKFGVLSLQGKLLQTHRVLSRGDLKAFTTEGSPTEAPGVVAAKDLLNVFSMSDRYQQMRSSLKQRLTFGKSAIHGWGVFTKQRHCAGDMVIEYAGEIVRPIVADLRERLIYNSLVGAGTYMFRIDDERVVDATCVGSIAHLINHSCEPNCFSRVVTISGEEHIIIFAKRDIEEGEELSYDYRFASKGEQLDCYCGFPSCRGFVNADDGDEEPARILVPRCDITAWIPERIEKIST